MPPGIASNDPTPVYYRLQTAIRQQIENGQWIPGERIPPERKLAETHKVSIGTVKKAILNLVYEGYLYRIQGKGTFVAGTTLRRESLRYYRLLKDFGGGEADLKINLHEIERIKGCQPYNRYLRLRINQGLYRIKRTFCLKESPFVYSISYLPQKMFTGLHECPVSFFEKITLYEALEKKYGVPTIYNHELIHAILADNDTAGIMNVETGGPLLAIDMLAFTYKDRPYEFRQSICLSGERRLFREI